MGSNESTYRSSYIVTLKSADLDPHFTTNRSSYSVTNHSTYRSTFISTHIRSILGPNVSTICCTFEYPFFASDLDTNKSTH